MIEWDISKCVRHRCYNSPKNNIQFIQDDSDSQQIVLWIQYLILELFDDSELNMYLSLTRCHRN